MKKHLLKLKRNKSSGPDNLGSAFLLDTCDFIIFNLSLKMKQVPNDWKYANVIQIFKKGNKSELGDYRPINHKFAKFWELVKIRNGSIPISLRILSLIRIFTGCIWMAKDAKFLHADSEDSDQTARMRRWCESSVGARQKIHFLTWWLTCFVCRCFQLTLFFVDTTEAMSNQALLVRMSFRIFTARKSRIIGLIPTRRKTYNCTKGVREATYYIPFMHIYTDYTPTKPLIYVKHIVWVPS